MVMIADEHSATAFGAANDISVASMGPSRSRSVGAGRDVEAAASLVIGRPRSTHSVLLPLNDIHHISMSRSGLQGRADEGFEGAGGG